jgi:O-antigen ligase
LNVRADAAARATAGGARWIAPVALIVVLALAAGWAVVYLPAWMAIAPLAGLLAATIWLQIPVISLYALAAIAPFDLSYQIGGLSDVRIQDALILTLSVSAVTALLAGSRRRLRLKVPIAKGLLALWLFLLIWGTVAFLLGPANQWLLKDATHNAWYVYRDIGRSLIVFPLVLLCLDNRMSITRMIDTMVATGVFVALDAIWLTRYSEENAAGPFGHQNALAGYMVMIMPLASAQLLLGERPLRRVLHGTALAMMLRALWLSGSRGGLVAFLASFGVLAIFVPRRRAVAVGAAGLVGLALVVALRGDLLNMPMMQRFIVLTDVKDVDTFQWRQEQWAIFIQRIGERPWLGTGSDVDESLRDMDRAQTAHNAFLALSVKSGIPSAVAWGFVLIALLWRSVGGVLRSITSQEKAFWVGALSFLVGLILDNLVESNLLSIPAQHCFWIVAACSLLMASPEGSMVGDLVTRGGGDSPSEAGASGMVRLRDGRVSPR